MNRSGEDRLFEGARGRTLVLTARAVGLSQRVTSAARIRPEVRACLLTLGSGAPAFGGHLLVRPIFVGQGVWFSSSRYIFRCGRNWSTNVLKRWLWRRSSKWTISWLRTYSRQWDGFLVSSRFSFLLSRGHPPSSASPILLWWRGW